MKLAIVHDHLVQEGGAESVAKAFQEIYPESPFYTLLYDKSKVHPDFQKSDIRTSFLQKIPFGARNSQWLLNWMPAATENHNLNDFDVVLSSSSIFSKGIITKPGATHICYCHTPPRFLWTDSHNYLKELKVSPIIKAVLPLFLTKLRQWDKIAADRVDHFIANSEEVKQRIKKYYNRDSTVIHPPVDMDKFYLSPKLGNYFLAGGRFVGYKRFDLIVEAFNRLNLPLIIFGDGPGNNDLIKKARKNITFTGRINDQEKAKLMSECLAFINPQIEDFGITALEAMASGRPVIAYKAGGALETIKENITGTFFDEQTWTDLADKVLRFKPELFNANDIRNEASAFDLKIFKQKIDAFIKEKIA